MSKSKQPKWEIIMPKSKRSKKSKQNKDVYYVNVIQEGKLWFKNPQQYSWQSGIDLSDQDKKRTNETVLLPINFESANKDMFLEKVGNCYPETKYCDLVVCVTKCLKTAILFAKNGRSLLIYDKYCTGEEFEPESFSERLSLLLEDEMELMINLPGIVKDRDYYF